MQSKNLKAFLTVARTLNFSEASHELNYAQSTVSTQIHALEMELDIQLFERIGHRIYLTEEGSRLLPLAEKMVAGPDSAESFHSSMTTLRHWPVLRCPGFQRPSSAKLTRPLRSMPEPVSDSRLSSRSQVTLWPETVS